MPHVRDDSTPQDSRDNRYRGWDQYDDCIEDEHDDELTHAFRDLIQRDPTVCDNCFLKRFSRVGREWWRGSFGWMDYERWIPYPERVEDMPAEEASGGTTLTCANCGHKQSKMRPIPKHQIQSRAENISETLDRKEITHNRDVLLMEVESRNTSQNQGKQDSHCFAPAVREAIRATRD
jgi:hypothetical protein